MDSLSGNLPVLIRNEHLLPEGIAPRLERQFSKVHNRVNSGQIGVSCFVPVRMTAGSKGILLRAGDKAPPAVS